VSQISCYPLCVRGLHPLDDHCSQVILLFGSVGELGYRVIQLRNDFSRSQLSRGANYFFHTLETKLLTLDVFPFKETICRQNHQIPGIEPELCRRICAEARNGCPVVLPVGYKLFPA
jgi:hypothetical protein